MLGSLGLASGGSGFGLTAPLSCAHALAALTAAITVMSGIRIRRGVIGSLYSQKT
jgi:hypothetical protein